MSKDVLRSKLLPPLIDTRVELLRQLPLPPLAEHGEANAPVADDQSRSKPSVNIASGGRPASTTFENWSGLEKEPLHFSAEAKSPTERGTAALLEHLCTVGEASLYKWASFPIELPPLLRDLPKIDFGEALFKAPRFDELEEVAFNFTTNQKRLNEQQLRDIRQRGEFEVDSINFPGQKHRWKLSWLLQKGVELDRQNLRTALAFALRFIVIYAKNRWNAKIFSYGHTVRGVRKAATMIADLFVGIRHTLPDRLSERLTWARIENLITELVACSENDEAAIDEFVQLFLDRYGWEQKSVKQAKKMSRQSVTEFQAKDANDLVDLSLSRYAELNELKLREIIAAENTIDWFTEYRDAAIERASKHASTVSTKEVFARAQRDVDEECLRKVFENIRASSKIAQILRSPRVVELLIESARFNRIVDEVFKQFAAVTLEHITAVSKELAEKFPVRSKIKTWFKRRVNDAAMAHLEHHRWFKYEKTLKRARDDGLVQSAYFLERDWRFVKDRETTLVEEFEKIRKPAREFRFKTKIWRPSNWKVYKVSAGAKHERLLIPTELSDRLCEVNTKTNAFLDGERGFHYEFEKSTLRISTTSKCGWRWSNFAHRVWKWTSNAIFYCLLVVPWCSELGLRGLVSPTQFYPGYRVSQLDGTLCRDPASRQHSFVSRIRALWRHIHKSRTKFEAAPDRGFVSKNVVRWLNVFWNYVIKGFVGTFLLCLVQPALCIVVTSASILAGITAPVWTPLVVLLYHIAVILLYDNDNAFKHVKEFRRNRLLPLAEAILYRFAFVGIVQPLLIPIYVLVLCPLAAFTVTLLAYVRFGLRSAWDAAMFALIVKRYGRVPAMNSFVARRVAGPGLSADYLYQIEPGQALALLELRLQLEELQHFEEQTTFFIDMPKRHFTEYVKEVFGPFGASVDISSGVFEELNEQASYLKAKLAEKVKERRRELRCDLAPGMKSKIKLERAELQKVLKLGAEMVADFYPAHVILRLLDGGRHADEKHFWHAKNLSVGDWKGLTSQLFSQIFSEEFLLPLEEADSRFQLSVEHIDATKYLDALVSGDHRDDLDAATSFLRSPSQKFGQITQPSFTAELFKPLSMTGGEPTFKVVKDEKEAIVKAERAFWAECNGLLAQPSLVMAHCYNRRHKDESIEIGNIVVRNQLRVALQKVERDSKAKTIVYKDTIV